MWCRCLNLGSRHLSLRQEKKWRCRSEIAFLFAVFRFEDGT
jgi:hypothetical protein